MRGMGIAERLRALVARGDDWWSAATGLGGVSDKVHSVTHRHGDAISDDELDSLYHRDGIAARIVDAPVLESMREGFRINVVVESEDREEKRDALDLPPGMLGTENGPGPGAANPKVIRARAQAEKLRAKSAQGVARGGALKEAAETSKRIAARLRELKAQEKLAEAWSWGRLFGAGIVIVGADDGQPLDQPLDEGNIRTVQYLQVVDRRYVSILRYNGDALSSDFGEPELLAISSNRPGTTTVPLRTVHASRCVIFGGTRSTAWQRALRYGWDASVLERCYEQLRRYNANISAVSQLVIDASQGVLRIKDLHGIVAAGQGAALQERIEIMDRTRSVLRSILLDMDEDFHREPTTFSGLEDVLRQSELDLAASIGWPVTFLFGRAPAGLSATGESDYRTITDLIRGEQVNTLRPRVEQLVRVIMLAQDGPTRGEEPENWDVVFNPLRQPTPAESAEIRKATAEADMFWRDLGVPKEALLRSHFRPDGFVADLELDVEAVLAEMGGEEAGEREHEAVTAESEAATREAEMTAAKAAAEMERGSAPEEAKDPQTALNGAQVTSMLEIITSVADGTIPRQTGVMILSAAFPLDVAQAEAIMGEVGGTFVPSAKVAAQEQQFRSEQEGVAARAAEEEQRARESEESAGIMERMRARKEAKALAAAEKAKNGKPPKPPKFPPPPAKEPVE